MVPSSTDPKATAERFPAWDEPRIRLWERLSQGAIDAAGAWHGYQLTEDILIAARFSERRITIRLACKTKPTTEAEQQRWENETKITEHFLGMAREGSPWARRADDTAKGVAFLYEEVE